jgi:hypothetical protein
LSTPAALVFVSTLIERLVGEPFVLLQHRRRFLREPYGFSYTESDSRLDAAYLAAIGVQGTLETPDATYTSQWEIEPVLAANSSTFVEWVIGPADTFYSGSYLELGTHLLATWPVAVNVYYYSNAFYYLPSD